ncbi:MAG TPA: CRISPR-associated endonuclease Cas2 [Candidatus Fraserbacteria bacterium]|nr:CRISPR-associated endonuclease Cas2 [Candidatus Fraserbacteria bacterium]
MYLILVYDVEQKRVGKVCKYLRRYLSWVQNSVFEGELTKAQLERVKVGLGKLIDPETDSIYLYRARDPKWVSKEILGQERGPTDVFI